MKTNVRISLPIGAPVCNRLCMHGQRKRQSAFSVQVMPDACSISFTKSRLQVGAPPPLSRI
jgi:hypothetical protein